MNTQTEYIKAELDGAMRVLDHLIAEQAEAEKAVESARRQLYTCRDRVTEQRRVIARLQEMMAAGSSPEDSSHV